jgi:hypothetical protein
MIKADSGNFECFGDREQLLLDFAFIYSEILSKIPEITVAVEAHYSDEAAEYLNKATDEEIMLIAKFEKLLP